MVISQDLPKAILVNKKNKEIVNCFHKVNPCFEPTFEDKGDNSPPFKIKYSKHEKLIALYGLNGGMYNLLDIFNCYEDANKKTQGMIDRTPGMKEKINNFFS